MVANIGGFTQGMDKAERELDRSTRNMQRQAEARATAIKQAFADMAAGIAAPLAAAFSVNAIAGFTTQLARTGQEIQRFATIAGTSAVEFQRWSAGAKQAGIDAAGMADIFKDVQEKVGDFVVTGGGELKDFFEGIAAQAGVTAEAFRNLSGPQALQLFYSTLEKAGVTQSEAIFYLEGLASNSSQLIPLLRDNAAGLNEAADGAARLGGILSDETVAASAAFAKSLDDLQVMTTSLQNTVASYLIPSLDAAAQWMLHFAQTGGSAELAAWALQQALDVVILGAAGVATAFEAIGKTVGAITAQLEMLGRLDFEGALGVGNAYIEDMAQSGQRLSDLFNKLFLDAGESAGRASTAVANLARPTAALVAPMTSAGKATREAAGATDDYADALKALDQEMQAVAKEEARRVEEARADVKATLDQVKAQKEAMQEYGLTASALGYLRAARLQDAAASLEQRAAQEETTNPAVAEAYREQAAALRELADLKQLEGVQQGAAELAADMQQRADEIGDYLSDALFDAFQDGKGFAKGLKDTLVSYFKSMILKPILAPISAGIAGMMTPGSASGSTGSATGIMDLFSSAGSLFGMTGVGASAGSLVASNMVGMMGGDALGTMIGMNSVNWGMAGGGGIMGGIGAALPWIGLGLGLVSLLSGAFKKPSNKAALGEVDLGTGELGNLGNMTGKKQAPQETMDARTLLLQALGTVGGALGASGSVRVDVGGRDGIQAAFGDEEMQSYGKDVAEALRDMYQRMLDDTEGVSSEFRGIVESMLETAPEQIAAFVAVVKDDFSVLMTEGEKFGKVQERLTQAFADLGFQVPQNVDEFRALADGLDLTTEEGRTLYGQLVALAPAFGQVEAAIRQIRDQIRDLNASSIRTLETAGMTNEEKYSFIDKELAADLDALRSATDPAQVSKLFSEINAGVMEAFSLLDEYQQKGLKSEFIDILREAEALANERLTVGGTITETEPQDVAGAVSGAMAGPANTIQTAGQAMQSAAQAIAAAVGGIPDRIVVQSHVSVSVPEVGR